MLKYSAAILTIAAQDFSGLVEFYKQLLNLKPALLTPNVYAEFHLVGLRLGIYRLRKASPKDTHQAEKLTGMRLCLEVEDLDEAIAHLTKLGYPPLGAIHTAFHGKEIDAFDPEGNGFILHQSIY